MSQNLDELHSIHVDELLSLIEADQPVVILDIRTSADRADWSILVSQHVDAIESLNAGDPTALDGFQLLNDGLVVTVSGAGVVSQAAAKQLRSRGIRARSLTGGMKAWSLAWNTAEIPVPGSSAEVVQVRRLGKGCLSYLIGSGGKAIVVDASLDPEVYVTLAERRGWSIGHVLDTHVHADHLSRSRALADQTSAALHMPVGEQVSFPVESIIDGDVLQLGDARLVARAAPGHTLESMVYQLDEGALFTGDTLFLTGVGRPDLEASRGGAATSAAALPVAQTAFDVTR